MSFVTVAFVLAQAFWAGVMVYSWATTYPMFRDIGGHEFVATHRTYERGLPLGVYLPFGAMSVAVMAAATFRPDDIPIGALWLALVALFAGVVTTALGAAPLHIWLIKHGKDKDRIDRMLAWNAARTVAAAFGLAASAWVLLALQ